MAVTFSVEVPKDPGTREKLEEIRERLGIHGDEDIPPGMLAHLESETPTSYRILDIWETEADLQRFFETSLGRAFEDTGYSPLEGPPMLEDVFSLVQRQRVASYDTMIRELTDAFTRNDPSVLDRYLHPDFVEYEQLPGASPGREGVKQMVAALHAAFDNFTMETLDVVSAPGRATSRCRITGTHVGEFMGIPATGRSVDVEAIDCYAIGSDGLVHEHRGLFDQATLMAQLGMIPEQPGPSTIELPQETRT